MASALGILGAAGLGALGSYSSGDSVNAAAESSDMFSDAISQGDAWSYNNTDAWNKSNETSQSTSKSKTYGSIASAQDVMNANSANAYQEYLLEKQMDFNAKQAKIARDYETAMSNTAYQRAVKDLMAAGLNPILAVNSMGASTPSVSAASSGLATAHKANAYADVESYSNSYSKGSSQSKSTGRAKSKSTSSSKSHSESHSEGISSGKSSQHSDSNFKGLLDGLGDLFQSIANIGYNNTHSGESGKSPMDGYDMPWY